MSTAEPPTKPGDPDWERIEGDYRAGLLSLREIAARDGNVTEGAIRKRAKRYGWERDLGARIQARADALVRKAEVRKVSTQLTPESTQQIVEANAQVIAQVRGEHRSDISRGRALAMKLLTELEHEAGDPALFAQLGELMRKEDEKGVDKLNDVYLKVISLPGRIEGVRKLAETLKNLIALEREAYDIRPTNDGPPATPPVSAEALKAMAPGDAYLLMVRGGK